MKILNITPISHIRGVVDILEDTGDVTHVPNASKTKIIELQKAEDYDAIYVNPNKLTYKLDKNAIGKSVKVICTASTGTNHIDKEFCYANNIDIISLTTDYEFIKKISSTAEHAFALTLSLIRNIPKSFDSVKKYEWDYTKFIGRQLNELTFGVVGYGRLGRMYSGYCSAFLAEVNVCDPYVSWCPYNRFPLKSIMSFSDVISLHVHLNEETKGMINKDMLRLSFRKPYIINTSRGEVVDEDDIIEALKQGWISGYATDVIIDELGNVPDSKIIQAAKDGLNIVITPHIGGMTKEAQEIAYNRVANKLREWTNK